MHHALQIQEILTQIFEHCCPEDQIAYSSRTLEADKSSYPTGKFNPDLAALARTCRAFKEPALDLLWSVLFDLSPLARCIPEASYRASPQKLEYSFSRPLMPAEWDVLQSHMRRIRCIETFHEGLDWESVATFVKCPMPMQPFSNLRILHCSYKKEIAPWLQRPLPLLVYLDIFFSTHLLFLEFLRSFPILCPNVRTLSVHTHQIEDTPIDVQPNYMSRWRNLCSVSCPQIAFDQNTLFHLSRLPALTRLFCVANIVWPASVSPFVFSNLRELELYSGTSGQASHFISNIRLPVLSSLFCGIDRFDYCQEVFPLTSAVQISNTGYTMETLQFEQINRSRGEFEAHHLLAHAVGYQDLRPLLPFKNLRQLHLDTHADVSLTDQELLTLAPAWPKMEDFVLNVWWGWKATTGITPGGLLAVLKTWPMLCDIALNLDTRGYTAVPPSHVRAIKQLTLQPELEITIVDSPIEMEAVPAVVSLFCEIGRRAGSFFELQIWLDVEWARRSYPEALPYVLHWHEVRVRVDDVLSDIYADAGTDDEESDGSDDLD